MVDFTMWRAVWHHLVDIMDEDVDQLGVDVSIASLSNLSSFWNQLAEVAWHEPAPPSPEEIDSMVQRWTLERTEDQIMSTLVSLWKDADPLTAGVWRSGRAPLRASS